MRRRSRCVCGNSDNEEGEQSSFDIDGEEENIVTEEEKHGTFNKKSETVRL